MHLMKDFCWLGKTLVQADDSLWEISETYENEAVVVVVSANFNCRAAIKNVNVCLSDDWQTVLEAICFKTKLCKLAVET